MPRLALAGLAVLAAACSERQGSDGSSLDGPRSWQALAGDMQPVALGALPPDTLSVTVMATSPDPDTLTLGVRDSAGRVLVDPMQPEDSPNRVLPGRGRVVATIPAASASLPLASDYLVAPAGSSETMALSAWIKHGAVPSVQELPLALIVVGGAASVDRLDLALGEVGRIWRAAGIEVGEPVRIAVGGPEAEELKRVEVDPALAGDSPMVGQALALSARAPAGTLSLVVVGDVALTGPGYPIWALAGGIPVPPVSGTPRSGVVVSAVLVQQDPVWAGQVMAHEMGHALGLYHTTEAALTADPSGAPAAVHDLVDDTPACPATADRAPDDGTLSAAECADFDGGNLMFWAAARGATALTAEQADLARRSPLAR